MSKQWTHEEKVAEVQRWAISRGFAPITLPCGHVFCADKVEDGRISMAGGTIINIADLKSCPLAGSHDEQGRAINP